MFSFFDFLISGKQSQKMRSGLFPPFGFVLPEFGLKEPVLTSFWAFFDLWQKDFARCSVDYGLRADYRLGADCTAERITRITDSNQRHEIW